MGLINDFCTKHDIVFRTYNPYDFSPRLDFSKDDKRFQIHLSLNYVMNVSTEEIEKHVIEKVKEVFEIEE